MINTFDFQLEHPTEFAQLTVKEMLFLYYKCPQIEKKMSLYTHFNKIFFVLDGKKTFHQRNRSWDLTTGKSFMITKAAYEQEQFYPPNLPALPFAISKENELQRKLIEPLSNMQLRCCQLSLF